MKVINELAIKSRSGFTLLEMIVTISIIALFAGMASQLLNSSSDRMRFEESLRKFCSTLRMLQSSAIAQDRETSVSIDLLSNSYFADSNHYGSFPDKSNIILEVAGNSTNHNRNGSIVFFPDGSSTGADVSLISDKIMAKVTVNWLTGNTTCIFQ